MTAEASSGAFPTAVLIPTAVCSELWRMKKKRIFPDRTADEK